MIPLTSTLNPFRNRSLECFFDDRRYGCLTGIQYAEHKLFIGSAVPNTFIVYRNVILNISNRPDDEFMIYQPVANRHTGKDRPATGSKTTHFKHNQKPPRSQILTCLLTHAIETSQTDRFNLKNKALSFFPLYAKLLHMIMINNRLGDPLP